MLWGLPIDTDDLFARFSASDDPSRAALVLFDLFGQMSDITVTLWIEHRDGQYHAYPAAFQPLVEASGLVDGVPPDIADSMMSLVSERIGVPSDAARLAFVIDLRTGDWLFGHSGNKLTDRDLMTAKLLWSSIARARRYHRHGSAMFGAAQECSRLQHRLLPRSRTRIGCAYLERYFSPCDAAGGDLFIIERSKSGNILLANIDVSGHGFGAAMLTTAMHVCFRQCVVDEVSLLEIVSRLEEVVSFTGSGEKRASAFLGSISESQGTLSYVIAGAEPPLLWRPASGVMEVLDPEDGTMSFLGGGIDQPSRVANTKLASDDTLVLLSDGFREALSPSPQRRMFSQSKVREALERSDKSAGSMISSLVAAVYAHTQSKSRDDDQTMIVLRYEP